MKNLLYFFILTVLLFTNSCTDDEHIHDFEHIHDTNMEMSSITVPIIWELEEMVWTATVPFEAVTQDALEDGAVLVYGLDNFNTWRLLPFTFPQGGYENTIQVFIVEGGVVLIWVDTDLYTPDYPFITQIRIVVIEE